LNGVLGMVEATGVSSLLEMGVGINLALALLDGFKQKLQTYATDLANGRLKKSELSEGLDILSIAESSSKTSEVIKKATEYEAKVKDLPEAVNVSNTTWDILKFVAVTFGLILFLHSFRFSFGGYKLDDFDIWVIAIISGFPFLVIACLLIRSLCKSWMLKRSISAFLDSNDVLIGHLRECQQRTVP
jgi:hypothetical protein